MRKNRRKDKNIVVPHNLILLSPRLETYDIHALHTLMCNNAFCCPAPLPFSLGRRPVCCTTCRSEWSLMLIGQLHAVVTCQVNVPRNVGANPAKKRFQHLDHTLETEHDYTQNKSYVQMSIFICHVSYVVKTLNCFSHSTIRSRQTFFSERVISVPSVNCNCN